MNRKQFEKELLDMGFTPMSQSNGNDTYSLVGGTIFGHRNRGTFITTNQEGYTINHKKGEGMNFGRSVKWQHSPKTAAAAIKKLFDDFGL